MHHLPPEQGQVCLLPIIKHAGALTLEFFIPVQPSMYGGLLAISILCMNEALGRKHLFDTLSISFAILKKAPHP